MERTWPDPIQRRGAFANWRHTCPGSDLDSTHRAEVGECQAHVIIAASAAEAIDEIERRKPDVLVSDLGMPEQDGYELIKKIRGMESADHTARIPALALTAYAKAEDRVRALASGYQASLEAGGACRICI